MDFKLLYDQRDDRKEEVQKFNNFQYCMDFVETVINDDTLPNEGKILDIGNIMALRTQAIITDLKEGVIG